MINGSFIVPLSPPSSPRMSAYSASQADNEWHSDIRTLEHTPPHSDSDLAMLHAEVNGHDFESKRPMIRSHKSFPYLLDTNPPFSGGDEAQRLDQLEQHNISAIHYGGSAPVSPMSRSTPPSAHDHDNEDKVDNDDDMLDEKDDLSEDQDKDGDKPPMSAAEIRAAKRKMKRFRLTHNQTRFLMSEFARQAHPDAAHRERLAREIPGLSPRQVQVWFQNRRAKLKRLTTDDRERMMRSRALPDDFDMAQALHSPFGTSHGIGSPLASPAPYAPAFPENTMMRPLSIDTLRRGPLESHISPTGISSAFPGFTFTQPQPASHALSPVSPHESCTFGFHNAPIATSPRTSNPFSMPVTNPPAYAAQHSIPRLTVRADHAVGSRAESLHSPLGTSMGYTHAEGRIDGAHGPNVHTEGQRSYSSSMMPYGIGYSYASVPGFQATSTNRMRSFSIGIPRCMELGNQYPTHRNVSTPQTAPFPPYQTSPTITSQPYTMPQLSAPHNLSTFANSYLHNDSGHPDPPYAGVGAVLGEVIEDPSQEADEHRAYQVPA